MMPGFVLHQGASVMCLHAGQAQPVTPNPRVIVSGQPVVTQTTLYSIVGCGLTGTTTPPCATAQWMSAATRVRASGIPVLVQDSQAICTPTGTGLVVAALQMRVRGV